MQNDTYTEERNSEQSYGKNERTCNAAASAQTARVCRNFCAFEKIAEKRRWERHKIL